MTLPDPLKGAERQHLTKEQAIAAMMDDIDPMKFAGEGHFATDEYARPSDIDDKYVRGDIMGGGEDAYYPPPDKPRKRRK